LIEQLLEKVDIESRMAKIMTIMPQLCVKNALNEQEFISKYKEKQNDKRYDDTT
jgi:hypothetical protein